MTTIKTKTIDTSTVSPGKGGNPLPVVPAGTKVTVRMGDKAVSFQSGWSTAYQLCAAKGSGLELHNFLVAAGASRTSPVEVEISFGAAEEVAAEE